MVVVHSYDVDVILRKLGDRKPDENEVIGIFLGWQITRKEAKLHPEILQDFRYLDIHRINTEDWKCDYCGYIRPKGEYKCGICGGPRTQPKPSAPTEVEKEFKKNFFRKWVEQVKNEWLSDESQIRSVDL